MSKLFQAYRAIGLVTDGNEFTVQRLGKETFVTVTLKKSFQVQGAPDCLYMADRCPPLTFLAPAGVQM